LRTSLFIDNKPIEASNGALSSRRNPVTGEVYTEFAAATPEDARAAVDAAAAAFPTWSKSPPGLRRDILLNAARLLKERAEQFMQTMVGETGASRSWARFNASLAADMLVEAASLTTHIKGEIIPANKPGSYSFAFRRPVGVVLSMVPWNAPIILAVRSFGTALACGNTVVLKASEFSPGTQFMLAELMRDAGLPPGVLNFVTHTREQASAVVEAMIAHPAVRRVNFTGSTATGRVIAQMGAKYLKPVLLELGGKAPLIVLDDADIDNAVRAAAFGAYMHQGQICMSTERVILHRDIADTFAEKMTKKVRLLSAGDPNSSDAPLGSLITPDAAIRVQRLIDDAIEKGAKPLVLGARDGAIMQPTLLDHVGPKMKIFYEESFGPVTCLVRVDDLEAAIKAANDTEYGLKAAIFSRDVKRALAIADRLEFGCCHINGPTVYDEAQMPLGGMKESGYGRFGGHAGINEFTEAHWVSIEDPEQHYPI
jgi:acyl-CoA reductase-like NAD-dependent aldehyde dehydrogenase